jgi:hypothetical protein
VTAVTGSRRTLREPPGLRRRIHPTDSNQDGAGKRHRPAHLDAATSTTVAVPILVSLPARLRMLLLRRGRLRLLLFGHNDRPL